MTYEREIQSRDVKYANDGGKIASLTGACLHECSVLGCSGEEERNEQLNELVQYREIDMIL